jgi:hypothetical protein
VLYAMLYNEEVDSSIRDFSYIWSPGGFDLEYVQVNEGDTSRPQQQSHEANTPVSYPGAPL